MKNKKYLCIFLIVICLIVVAICMFKKNSNNSLIGTWKIESFIYEDEIISFDKYGEYYGGNNQSAMKQFSISFNSDNTGYLIPSNYSNTT